MENALAGIRDPYQNSKRPGGSQWYIWREAISKIGVYQTGWIIQRLGRWVKPITQCDWLLKVEDKSLWKLTENGYI